LRNDEIQAEVTADTIFSTCWRANGTDGFLLVPKMLYDNAEIGMAGALRQDGLNTDALDFAAALALSNPEIDRKWRKGWPVFASARLDLDGAGHRADNAPRPAATL